MTRIQRRIAIFAAAMVSLAALPTMAADAKTPIDGIIVSVDGNARTFTVKQKSSDKEIVLHAPADEVFHTYTKASPDELRTGDAVKVYGKVAKSDDSMARVREIDIMPDKVFGSDGKIRMDGTLILKDWRPAALQLKDKKVPLGLAKKCIVRKVFKTDFGFLASGMRVGGFRATQRNGQWEAVQEVRNVAPRQVVESYLPAKPFPRPVTVKRKMPIDGTIVSIDAKARRFTVKLKKDGEEIIMEAPKGQMFHVYTKGKPEDLQSGAWVKIYGKVADEGAALRDIRHICVMPEQRYLNDGKHRMDGQLVMQDGKPTHLTIKDETVTLATASKFGIEKVFDVDFGFLEKGMRISGFHANELPDCWMAVREIRLQAPRAKAEAYTPSK